MSHLGLFLNPNCPKLQMMAVCKADGDKLMWMGTKTGSIPL